MTTKHKQISTRFSEFGLLEIGLRKQFNDFGGRGMRRQCPMKPVDGGTGVTMLEVPPCAINH